MQTIQEIRSAVLMLLSEGRTDEAEVIGQQLLEAVPCSPDALHLAALIALQKRQTDDATAYVQRAMAIVPDAPQLLMSLGACHLMAGRAQESISCFQRAIELKADYAEAYYNLGNALRELGRLEESVRSYGRALELRPLYSEAENNLGRALERQGRSDEAVSHYRRALEINPNFAAAHTNLGIAAQESGNFALAATHYNRAIELDSVTPWARWNHSMLLLLLGDFENGWREYESRWETGQFPKRIFRQPRWTGEPLGSRTMLIYCEQGLGDAIQFIRYVKIVKDKNPLAKLIVESHSALLPLLAKCTGIDHIVAEGGELPPFDVHVALLSLPRVLGTRLETMPNSVPYLFANATLIDSWHRRLSPVEGFRIGVNWHGQEGHQTAWKRDLPLEHVASLAKMAGAHLISLQKGSGQKRIASMGDNSPIIYLGDDIDTAHGAFMDTAAIMMNLDLVITSDTSIAHLAGALGVPVWVALPFVPDWRWLLDRSDSPWYPTMRLFRQQSPGDWGSVFDQIKSALLERLTSRG